MRSLAASAVLVIALVAGCGGDDSASDTGTATVPNESPSVVILYFLRDGKVAPVARGVVGDDLAAAAVEELVKGPGTDEGLDTAIPSSTEPGAVEINGDLAVVGVRPEPKEAVARAQIVYTLTAIPTIKRVSFGGGEAVGRKAFEDQTPPILVESPLPDETVEPGFDVKGTANTFEATFNYELKDASGKVLNKDFVTATSGSGTRGTFLFTVAYEVEKPQDGKLLVFELSAEDGSRIHESEIPLHLE
jgi:hypothetical protein